MNTSIDLSGQVALVTGGGRGIGREIAQQLANAGATIAVAARTRAQLNKTVAAITAAGGQCNAFEMDVTNLTSVKQAVAAVTEQLGPIDLLVNNAGIGANGAAAWDVDPKDWWRVMEVNVRGVFNCTNVVLSTMVARNQGRIINVGSNAGVRETPMASAYGASKAALIHLSNTIGEELSDTDVSIFTFSPGLVYTDMTKDVPLFKTFPDSAWVPIELAGEICVLLASGAADKLSGRYFHVREDDVAALIEQADKVIEQDAQTLRLRQVT